MYGQVSVIDNVPPLPSTTGLSSQYCYHKFTLTVHTCNPYSCVLALSMHLEGWKYPRASLASGIM